jgi:ATP-dependent helicase/DNAse subunit B
MVEAMSARRNAQRQQQIVDDTAKLLELAQKLNSEVSKSDKDTLSIPVVKEAEEIEKLAKSIKEKMRDGMQ